MLLAVFYPTVIDDVCRHEVNDDCITEIVMIRDGIMQLSSDVFTLIDTRDVISFYVLASTST